MIGPDPEWQVQGSLRGVALLPQLGRLRMPALVIAGRHDPVSPPAVALQMQQALARGRLQVFEHSAHRPALEEPAAWGAMLSEFLA